MSNFKNGEINYLQVLNTDMQFGVGLKVLPTEGNLVYEYNPFHNYRLSETGYVYKNRLFTPRELLEELEVKYSIDPQLKYDINGNYTVKGSNLTQQQCLDIIDSMGEEWPKELIPDNETNPVLVEEGELTDFETNELSFDLHHPVDLLPQYSYDNSVNLIINDGKNKPKLINSRFSTTSRNKYQIVDRKGNNDTNIYDQGSQFDIDTSLYKKVIEIPRLRFVGTISGGRLSIGNYHFYFRYADADGNETDFVAESGLVSIFIGNDPSSIRSGFRNEDSHKGVQFILSNIDSAYQYVNVYYTKSSSDIFENATTQAYKIEQKYLVNNALNCNVIVTGYEEVTEIPLTDINPMYLMADSVETQAQCQNMLFLGNIVKPNIPYEDLTDLSLRFIPTIQESEYELDIDADYNIRSNTMGYYDPKFIYNNVGYWNHEFYRLGIVYIMSDNSLSPVFNIRGVENLGDSTEIYSAIPMWTNGANPSRNYIVTEEDTYRIVADKNAYSTELGELKASSRKFENAKGVISLDATVANRQSIYGIQITTATEVIDYLKNTLKIKGFFFVRQKRIPTILCQAFTIGIDQESRTPILPIEGNKYVAERFINDDKKLTHDFDSRKYIFEKAGKVRKEAAICPEYDVNYPYFNSIFTGDKFSICESDIQPANPYLTTFGSRNFVADGKVATSSRDKYTAKIIGVEDNVKLVAINDKMFSARAGEAEEAFRFEFLEKENKTKTANNLVRGSFGPYLGITGFSQSGRLIDIKIPGFNEMPLENIFRVRYNDKSYYAAISDRIALRDIEEFFDYDVNKKQENVSLIQPLYRGDCYICQFTHRLNRNFQDPSAPANDKIVDEDCWEENFEYEDKVLKVENFEEINLGDVNAVQLGMWVTFTVRSTSNLNIRTIDDSIPDEIALFGNPRTFYPYGPISAEGAYKIPEALCYNKGFEKSISERWNYEVPDVPAIKNDFTNRIAYSDIHVNDAFKNGFRVFQGTHYRDYPKTYGSITKLIELQGNLLCVFEHGIALIPVNERAVAGEGSGGNVYINTSNVLPENPKVISDTFGSQWKESIIKTPRGVYGVDTVGKKIWRTNGQSFECISDFRIQEFLNNNISLTERELEPVIGVRNVKTHYNKFKNDVMFTFYDNLYGFEEKVWNLCWNENLQKWITFYSWVPSYSENIYNQYFSFDRNTSKWIAKLGVSSSNSDFADGVTLESPIITGDGWKSKLSLSNRTLPTGPNIDVTTSYELVRDNYGNYKNFKIDKEGSNWYLYFIGSYEDIKSELYEKNGDAILKDDRGRKVRLKEPKNADKIVRLLNIRANISVSYEGEPTLEEAYAQGSVNNIKVDAGYYQSVVAVIPKYNMQFLTTDFWKHGQAGIIDITDPIRPTYWYGKQHPFEFEFVVADNPDTHKIFDNLEIIGNKAEPESFHYEIVGECYDFQDDKKNMYIRQEATKELYQFNGEDITFDHNYKKQDSTPRPVIEEQENDKVYKKSTIFPLYYTRHDTINEIEDHYHSYKEDSKDFSALAGAELVYYDNLDEYRIWNHAKAVNVEPDNLLRGNMYYKEDKWNVQINPINLVQKNEKESEWKSVYGDNKDILQVPAEYTLFPLPNLLDGNGKKTGATQEEITLPSDWTRNIVSWKDYESINQQIKLKDKFMKVRIRYSGEDLAIISAIKTLYSISYG